MTKRKKLLVIGSTVAAFVLSLVTNQLHSNAVSRTVALITSIALAYALGTLVAKAFNGDKSDDRA